MRSIPTVVKPPSKFDPHRRRFRSVELYNPDGSAFGSGVYNFPGPISIDDPDGVGAGTKLGTIDLGEPRFQVYVSMFIPTADMTEFLNLGDYYLVLVPEGVDPFDPNVIDPNRTQAMGSQMLTEGPVAGSIMLSSLTYPTVYIVLGDLTEEMSPVSTVDVWITHDVGYSESMTLTDGVEVRIL